MCDETPGYKNNMGRFDQAKQGSEHPGLMPDRASSPGTAKDIIEARIRKLREAAQAQTTLVSESLSEANGLEVLLKELPELSPRADRVLRQFLGRL